MPVADKQQVFTDTVHAEIGLVFHHFEVQRGEEIRATQRTTGVAALGAVYHSYDISSYLGGDFLKGSHVLIFFTEQAVFPQQDESILGEVCSG